MIWVVLAVAVLVVLGALGVAGRLPGVRRRSTPPPSGGGRLSGRGGGQARPAGRGTAGTTRPGTRPGSGTGPGTRRGSTGHASGTGGGGRRATGGDGAGRGGAATQAGPRPGEIWWADVPYEDGPGHKVRPCVVLRTYRGGAEVLKITSQDRSDRDDHVEIPTRAWDPDADHNSFLDLTGPVRVPVADFQDRAGTLDARVWRQVCRLHEISPN
ncbi:type II toxin-antitoxin system PemK/MazF family toxin [Microbispora sp. H13382]|uniref:type II toxin-antitoxin system PemK/MazF family toxin n=1 Tax=Microbispora sp. H13382 TaxID=2729112 RepID=UPI001601D21E|nr:type II toxin-antitoxin system PemK/MazF family toxin [Microbispora sp. H13382]